MKEKDGGWLWESLLDDEDDELPLMFFKSHHMEGIAKKRIQVRPNTWIEIDADANAAEAVANWTRKHAVLNKTLDVQQRRREGITIRGGKVLQRTKFKR
jgi:hypothetical protein